jgi:proteasome lid subunit RPN8/RPN11
MNLTLSHDLLEALHAAATNAGPMEACGILIGQGRHIDSIQPTRNVHPAPRTHFEIDPQALIDAHRSARGGGPEIIGYYHSHPVGPPEPSATDRAMAAGDGKIWAIIGQAGVKFWRDAPSGFEAVGYIEPPR